MSCVFFCPDLFIYIHTITTGTSCLQVNDIFQDIMRQTKRAVKEASWLSEELQEHIKQKVNNVLTIAFAN